MPTKLETVIDEIKAAQASITKDLSVIPIASRNAFIMAANQAKQAMKGLKQTYEATLLSKSIVFYPVGTVEQQEKFADLSVRVGKSIVIDGDSMYRGFATFIAPSIGQHQEFTVNQLTKLNLLLQETAEGLGLSRAFFPTLKGLAPVRTFEELVACIKDLVIASNGHQIVAPFIRNLISTKALEAGFNSKVLTVVILNTNQDDRTNLSFNFTKSVVVDLNSVEKINEDFVNKIIRNAFKG